MSSLWINSGPRAISYIWETRIRDNRHLGVVDISCQPAKAKTAKRRNSAAPKGSPEAGTSPESDHRQRVHSHDQYYQREHSQVRKKYGVDC